MTAASLVAADVAAGTSAYEAQVTQTLRGQHPAGLEFVDWLRVPELYRERARDARLSSGSYLRRPVPTKAALRGRTAMSAAESAAAIGRWGARVVFDPRTAPRTVAVLEVAGHCVTEVGRMLPAPLRPGGVWDATVRPVRDVFDEIVHQAVLVVYGSEAHGREWRYSGWQSGNEGRDVEEFETLFTAGAVLAEMTRPYRLAWQQRHPLV